jgi:hypothetical protein
LDPLRHQEQEQAHASEVQLQLAEAEKTRGREFCEAMLNVRESVKRLQLGECATRGGAVRLGAAFWRCGFGVVHRMIFFVQWLHRLTHLRMQS